VIIIFEKEDGAVLVLSIIIIAVLMTLITALAGSINSNISFTKRHENDVKAFYAAEGALELALNNFSDPNLWSKDDENTDAFDFSDYKYENSGKIELESVKREFIYNEDEEDRVKIKAKAKSQNVEREIISIYRLDLLYNPYLNNLMTIGNQIDIGNNQIISSGDIQSKYGLSSGSGSFKNISGEEIEVQINNELQIPTFDFLSLKNKAKTDGEYRIGYTDYNSETINNFRYIDGDVNVGKDGINGNGVLVVNGDLTTVNNTFINKTNNSDESSDDYLIVIVNGSVNAEQNGNPTLSMQGFLYTTGDIYFKNDFSFIGSIMAGGDFELKNHNASEENLTYDPGFIKVFNKFGLKFNEDESENGGITLGDRISWEER
jgi:hypothetical protein